MPDFSVEGGPQNVRGSEFSRVERKFTIGQSPKICGTFSKLCIKINLKIEKLLGKFKRKCKFFRKFL